MTGGEGAAGRQPAAFRTVVVTVVLPKLGGVANSIALVFMVS